MFAILKTDYFQLWVLYNSDFRISTAGKYKGIIRKKGNDLAYWHFFMERNWVSATNSNFLLPISLQPIGENLKTQFIYLKLRLLPLKYFVKEEPSEYSEVENL